MHASSGRKPLFLVLMWKIIQDENGGPDVFDARGAFL